MSTPESYESAVERLEQIIARLDTGQAGLRETLDLCREGKTPIDDPPRALDAARPSLPPVRLESAFDRDQSLRIARSAQ